MDSSQANNDSAMWTTELHDYCLVDLTNSKEYSIYKVSRNCNVIIEDDNAAQYIIDQLLLAGARIITSVEEFKLLSDRPFRPWSE